MSQQNHELPDDFRAAYLHDVVAELSTPWPDNRTVNIVCHGHSVPAGYFRTPEVCTFDSYPHLLHAALKKQYPNACINVIVTAVGGESSDRGAERFAVEVLPHRPDVITIDYALNDRKIGLAAAENAWGKMIEMALAAGVKLILLTPTPDLSANLFDDRDMLERQAQLVRSLAIQYKVGLADILNVFRRRCREGTKLEELMSDVRHPNRYGHQLVVSALLPWFT